MEQPILRIGIAGFSPTQYRLIESGISRPSGLPRWQICPFGEADAWLVNGAKVRMTPDGILRVAPGLPTEQSVRLNPAEVDRPVAFASPMESPDIEPRCKFDVESVPSIQGTLLQLENWLRPVRVLFALGCDVVRYGPQLRHGVFHVSNAGGALLAVLDFHEGRAGVSPRAHPADFQSARWDRRPVSAGDIPQSFIHTSPAELAWNYARRSEKDLLPARYMEQLVYFRGAPRVPPRWVTDSQLMLLRELATEPCTLSTLQQRTGITGSRIEREMACLYFAGAITTTRSKAVRGTSRLGTAGPLSAGAGIAASSLAFAQATFTPDITAPASLEYRRAAASAAPAFRNA